jgi:hypothetical protein
MQTSKPRLLRWVPPSFLLPPGSKFVINGAKKVLGYVDEHSTTNENKPTPAEANAIAPRYSPTQYVILQTFMSSFLDHCVDKYKFDAEAVRNIGQDLGISLSLIKLMEYVPFGNLIMSVRNLQQALLNAKSDQESFISVLKFLTSMGISSVCYSSSSLGPIIDATANHYILPYIDLVAKTELGKRASKRFDKTVQDVKQTFTSKL